MGSLASNLNLVIAVLYGFGFYGTEFERYEFFSFNRAFFNGFSLAEFEFGNSSARRLRTFPNEFQVSHFPVFSSSFISGQAIFYRFLCVELEFRDFSVLLRTSFEETGFRRTTESR